MAWSLGHATAVHNASTDQCVPLDREVSRSEARIGAVQDETPKVGVTAVGSEVSPEQLLEGTLEYCGMRSRGLRLPIAARPRPTSRRSAPNSAYAVRSKPSSSQPQAASTSTRSRAKALPRGSACPNDRLPEDPRDGHRRSDGLTRLNSGRCGATDREVPVATREIQRPKNQEEGCPSVGGVREANDARGSREGATGNTRDPKDAEVAVFPWVDQALHAGSRGRYPPPAKTFPSGVVVGCVHRGRPAHARFRDLK